MSQNILIEHFSLVLNAAIKSMVSLKTRTPKAAPPGAPVGARGPSSGARGSILGMGTDIGGSIRIPGHFNGVCGLKPGSHRLRYVEFHFMVMWSKASMSKCV